MKTPPPHSRERAAAEEERRRLAEEEVYGLPSAERQAMLADQERIQEVMSTLERSSIDAGIGVAEMTGDEMPVPSPEELEAFDPWLVAMREAILRDQNDLDKIRPRLKESHRLVRKLTLGIETQQRSLEDAFEQARAGWYAGPGQALSYRNLQLERDRLKDRLLTRRERMQQLQEMAQVKLDIRESFIHVILPRPH